MKPSDIRNHISKQCGFKLVGDYCDKCERLKHRCICVETPRTVDPNGNNETGYSPIVDPKVFDQAHGLRPEPENKANFTQGKPTICETCGKPITQNMYFTQAGTWRFWHWTCAAPVSEHTSRIPHKPIQNKAKPYAIQVCNAGAMPEDFTAWLKANGDSIDIGGNWTPDKVQANHDQYDNTKHPFS